MLSVAPLKNNLWVAGNDYEVKVPNCKIEVTLFLVAMAIHEEAGCHALTLTRTSTPEVMSSFPKRS